MTTDQSWDAFLSSLSKPAQKVIARASVTCFAHLHVHTEWMYRSRKDLSVWGEIVVAARKFGEDPYPPPLPLDVPVIEVPMMSDERQFMRAAWHRWQDVMRHQRIEARLAKYLQSIQRKNV